MSTDNLVTVIIRTKRTLNMVWTADSKGLPGSRYFHDLEEVRGATP